MLEGELVTYRNGAELGRERYRDDGKVLTSDVVMAGLRFRVVLDRARAVVRVEQGEAAVERTLGEGEVALENGSFQACAALRERVADEAVGTAVGFTALVPGQGARVRAEVALIRRDADGACELAVTIAATRLELRVGADGAVVWARVKTQGIEVRAASEPPPPAGNVTPGAPRAEVPADVVEEPFEARGADGARLRGTLARPATLARAAPVAVIIAGSGPTDRDGNGRAGLRTDAYRLLAHGLAQRGVASVRYDKRGVGASEAGVTEADVRLAHFVDDARAVVAAVRDDARFGPLTVAGHSEGGLIAIELAQTTAVDALVLIATAGRPLGEVLREQLARSLPDDTMPVLDRALAAIVAGSDPSPLPASLAVLLRASVRPFLASVLALDPAARLAGVASRVTIVQGETDVQVTVQDARRLSAARPDARLVLLPRVNHVLKEEGVAALPQESYTDPSRPLGPGVLDGVFAGVAH